MQGFCKFGFYDLIKTKMFAKIDDEKLQKKLHLPVLIASSAMAETIASWALCPMEMTRLFMVTNPSRCSGMLSAMGCIIRDDGIKGLFKGLPFIMMRQIPYTCAKLVGYDIISDSIKSGLNMTSEHGSDSVKEVLVHLSSGIAAGVLAATISQPADVLLSKTCGKQSVGSECLLVDGPVAVMRAFRQLGVKQSFAGLKPRAMMIGTLTAMQFAIYEATKIRVSKSIDRLYELNDDRIRSNNDRQVSTKVSPSGNSRGRKNPSQTGTSKSKLLPKVEVLRSTQN
jgi:solute carrier family 25 phosphate transporter 3